MNRRGERGHPCLTPLSIWIFVPGAREGETTTSVVRFETAKTNHWGKP